VQAIGFWRYGGALRDAIVAWKNNPSFDLSEPLSSLYCDGFRTWATHRELPVDRVVAVPARTSALTRRGFNPAGMLAVRISSEMQSSSAHRHVRYLQGALKLTERGQRLVGARGARRQDRLVRTRGVFEARSRSISGQHIWLVDDVMTTGATVSAATTALLQAGALSVRVGVLARVEGLRCA
jgi:predicted amidophosphoribosyltransferase